MKYSCVVCVQGCLEGLVRWRVLVVAGVKRVGGFGVE